jgi:hypothetical protein
MLTLAGFTMDPSSFNRNAPRAACTSATVALAQIGAIGGQGAQQPAPTRR